MYKELISLFALVILITSLAAGCAPAPTATQAMEPTTDAGYPVENNSVPESNQALAYPAAAPEDASAPTLRLTGLVGTEKTWTEEEVRAMTVISVESTNKNGETETFDGVLISDLLNEAGPQAGAATLVFVADDGFTSEIALADVMACADCIVAFGSDSGFRTVLPGQEGKLQVKGLIEIQAK